MENALTRSGLGRGLTLDGAPLEVIATELVAAAEESGVALIRGLDLSRDAFKSTARAAGSLAEHRFGSGSSELLDLAADPDPEKVVTGRAMLPLHADGALVGTRPGIILLYANEYEEQPGFGRTVICDQFSALADLPPQFRSTVLGADWEYWVEDTSHFPTIAHQWVKVPPIVEEDKRKALNVALPFPEETPRPGWRVRLCGRSEEESRSVLASFSDFLEGDHYSYRHEWSKGDLLAINNRGVLHGREGVSEGGKRHLYRAQLQ